ncbi:MAG: hypothetical protein JAZ05_00640, partial [Candidatus Thiodiazotropha taylori]|nr:hypothetical protein [Candidatus Thiodiazotropha taylori]MCW4290511.1 hypothetical protein [Candidatus Thiodiazotropha taylori]
MLLYIFLFLIAADYAGLGTFVPAFKALPFTLVISILLFLYVVSKNKISELFQYKTVVYTSIFVLLTAFAGVHGLIKNYAIEPLKV